VFCLTWFIFALLSGVEEAGGVLRNRPNALPWVGLAFLVAVAFRYERLGGGLIVAAGLFTAVYFDTLAVWQMMVLIPLPLILFGGAPIYVGSIDPLARQG
jgi:hypothetical protein